MTDPESIGAAIAAARPPALGALLRYFQALDVAEEAFQEASLRALEKWPAQGVPRDAAAWLIFVGRNVALDGARRARKERSLPDEASLSDLDDAETAVVDRLDAAHHGDDVLRLLFICCHPELPLTQQIALALRVVCGLSVKQIARAFLVGEAAMEQRITRAKSRIASGAVPFAPPDATERATRLDAVTTVLYLMFNEGYTGAGGAVDDRAPLCDEAIRLARLLAQLFAGETELSALLALMLLQHARTAARFDAHGAIVLLEDQDRSRWDRAKINEGIARIDDALHRGRGGPLLVQAVIASLHARAPRVEETDWAEMDRLYGTLEQLRPSPVIRLNRAVVVSRARGAAEALAMIEPLETPLAGYFYLFAVKGTLLQQLGRVDEAGVAFDRALALANTPAEAAHIRAQAARVAAHRPRGGVAGTGSSEKKG